jgi:hypothetical protein
MVSKKFKRRVHRENTCREPQRQTIEIITENEIAEMIIRCAFEVGCEAGAY